MTNLEAVNEILAGIGEPPVSALGSAGTTEKEAQNRLEEERKRVLAGGYAVNTEEDITLSVPDVKVTLTGATSNGPFQYDEVITETTSGATGKFDSIHEQAMYIRGSSGTFTGGKNLTGSTTLAYVEGVTYSSVTTAPIGVALEDVWLVVRPHRHRGRRIQWPPFVTRPSDRTTSDPTNGNYLILYDTNDNLYTFDSSVRIDRFIDIAFEDLTKAMQDFITKAASVKFNRQKKGGTTDDAFLREELTIARAAAMREDIELSGMNMLNSHDAMEVRGQRRVVSFGVN